jgi:hypothetical protein
MPYTREPLSGSTHGRGIKVVATGTPGTTIHTGQASTTLTDVVTLYCCNTDTVTRRVTLEWGGTTSVDDNLIFDIPPKSTVPIVPDLIIRNSLIIKAFCDTANIVSIFGFINTEA